MEKKNRIIRHLNKKTGVTYLYWGHSTYVPGQTYPEVTKQCIGKINRNGEFEPNKRFLTFPQEVQVETGLLFEPMDIALRPVLGLPFETKSYGYTALIEKGVSATGIRKALQKTFPESWMHILTLLESLLTYPERHLYRPKHFQDTCWHTSKEKLTEHLITDTLKKIDSTSIQKVLSELRKKNEETTIPSTDSVAVSIDSADKDVQMEESQMPLLVFLNGKSLNPFAYRQLEGSSQKPQLNDIAWKELRGNQFRKGPFLVLTKRKASETEIIDMLRANYRFFIKLEKDDDLYKDAITEASEHIHDTVHYHEPYGVYGWRKEISIDAPRRGRGPNRYSLNLYIFLSPSHQISEQREMGRTFLRGKLLLEADHSLADQSFYSEYYHVIRNDNGGFIVEHNAQTQREAMKTCGMFVYSSGEKLPPERVYRMVRAKRDLEADFLPFPSLMKRPKHRIEEYLEAKQFLVFLMSIVNSWIRNILDQYLLMDTYPLASLREELLEAKWKKPAGKDFAQGQWSELSVEVQKLFHIFDITSDNFLSSNIPQLVRKELNKRKVERGLQID